jgi:hypothetical protein
VEIIKNKKRWYHNDDEDNDNKTTMTTTTNRMIAVQIGGGKRLRNIVWQGCDDPTHDQIRDCVRATQYHGHTMEHVT